jgi:hypothetical protein
MKKFVVMAAVAVAALAIAGAATAGAAKLFTGADVKNGSLSGLDIENGSLGRWELKSNLQDLLAGSPAKQGL